jgi:hypothetical protein
MTPRSPGAPSGKKALPASLPYRDAHGTPALFRLWIGARASGDFVALGPDERRRHLYFVGQTGTGKSTLLLTLLRQDFESGTGVALSD